ncbi:MAG: PTS transporter subunit IIC [Propionibacteriaceae bacterium]
MTNASKQAALPVAGMAGKITAGSYTMNILNALALGTVIALIPGALAGEISKAILSAAPGATWLTIIIKATAMCNGMLGLVVGVLAAQSFKFPPIAQGAVALAVEFAGGAVTFGEKNAMTLKGTGDVINIGITAALACGVVMLLQKSIKNLQTYAILIIPVTVLLTAGVIGRLILPYVMMITTWIGKGVSGLLGLTPIVMAVLIAIVFSLLIVSPITTVGIALAISLAGMGSGAGNLGVCAAGFGLAIAGWSVNSHGVCLAHFIGSPKMSMPKVLAKPKIMLPIICNAAVCGLVAALLNITGTPMSAGFGFSGLVGPLAYLSGVGWGIVSLIKALVAFIVTPVLLGFIFNWIFVKQLKIIKAEDYKLDIA